MKSLEKLIKFIKLTHDYRRVERAVAYPGDERFENDVEHSYQLALAAWYIISSEKLNLNIDKVLQYALLHDLVEVYAGDTPAYTKDANFKASKHEREQAALVRLREEYPEFKDAFERIESYEKRSDPEARFVYALDKVLPAVNIFLDNGRLWHQHGISLSAILNEKSAKVALSPEVQPYYDELIATLRQRELELFPKEA